MFICDIYFFSAKNTTRIFFFGGGGVKNQKKNIQFALDNLCYGAVLSPRLWRTQRIAMEMFCTCTEMTLLFSEFFSITGQNSLVISLPVIHKILTMILIQRCVTGTDEMLTLLPLHFLQSHNLALQALLLYA